MTAHASMQLVHYPACPVCTAVPFWEEVVSDEDLALIKEIMEQVSACTALHCTALHCRRAGEGRRGQSRCREGVGMASGRS